MSADLHCHSTCSDGTETPATLMQLAIDAGLSGLSITDHDTVAAYGDAFTLAAEKNLTLITGVEFSAGLNGTSVHILAYAFNPHHPLIVQLCNRHIERRQKRNAEIIELLRKHDMPLDKHDILRPRNGFSPDAVGRPHIAEAMVRKGFVKDLQEAFKKHIGDGKPCFAPGERFTVQETLDVIHQANGVAILAHPQLIERRKIVRELLEMEFDGLEAYYALFTGNNVDRWVQLAKERDWLITGGSDFHGTIKPHIRLGSSRTPQETVDFLLSVQKQNLQQIPS